MSTRESAATAAPAGGAGAGQGAVPAPEELTRVIALDGPAGSGKSTVARLTARALGWRFVDTGATYRAVTLQVLRSAVDRADPVAVAACVAAAHVEVASDPSQTTVLLDGEDVSAEIRGPEVTAAVSEVSAVPAVRQQLVLLQRSLIGLEGAVVEGRDIATVVAPHARLKVFLDARADVRARRRAGEAGLPADALEEHVTAVRDLLLSRDERDNQTNRLVASDGAVHLDTSDLSLDQVVSEVVGLAESVGLLATKGTPERPRSGRGDDDEGLDL